MARRQANAELPNRGGAAGQSVGQGGGRSTAVGVIAKRYPLIRQVLAAVQVDRNIRASGCICLRKDPRRLADGTGCLNYRTLRNSSRTP